MRPYWIWPVRFPIAWTDATLAHARRLGEWLGATPWWILVGCLLGVAPLLLDWVMDWHSSRLVTALLLAPLLIAAVSHDWMLRGIGVVAVTFFAHSALAIALVAHDPTRMDVVLPDGADYWQRSHDWIVTGASKEYDVRWWLPAHVQIFVAVCLFAYLSLGVVILWEALYQLDLMNFYVGQLTVHSQQTWLALGVGWHIWSLCRGLGCLLLTFEMVSLSLERMTGTPLSTPARRWTRWGLGMGFLVLDGVLKYRLLEPVRQALERNLW